MIYIVAEAYRIYYYIVTRTQPCAPRNICIIIIIIITILQKTTRPHCYTVIILFEYQHASR